MKRKRDNGIVSIILNTNFSNNRLNKVQIPSDYDNLNDDDKIVFLIVLYNKLWRLYGPNSENLMGLIEDFLGFDRLPRNRIGVSDLNCLPGLICARKEQLKLLGLHFNPSRNISYSCDSDKSLVTASIILNGESYEHCDHGTKFIYVANKGCKKSSDGDDSLANSDNLSLLNSSKMEFPVRLIRGYKGDPRYSPPYGYRYDGLYRVIDFYSDTGSSDRQVYKFVFAVIDTKFYKLPSNTCGMIGTMHPLIREKHPWLFNVWKEHVKLHKRHRIRGGNSRINLRKIDVIEDGRIVFRLSVPQILESKANNDSVVVNFYILYDYLKKVYFESGVHLVGGWFGLVEQFEMSDGDVRKPFWAKGFLPFVLRVKYKKLIYEEMTRMQNRGGRGEEGPDKIFNLPINKVMAERLARPFLPNCKKQGIFAELVLRAPMKDSWNPWVDLSCNEETLALPVVNTIDDQLPPLDFSYSKDSVCFSRVAKTELLQACPGCLPREKNTTNWPQLHTSILDSKIVCNGKRDPKTGDIYCSGKFGESLYYNSLNWEFTCGEFCPCDASSCRSRYPKGLQFRCSIVKTKTKNWELCTEEFIPKGSFVLQYAGEIINRGIMEGREHQLEKLGFVNYFMEAAENEDKEDDWKMPCVDSTVIGNAARFLNHSCNPNIEVRTVWCCSEYPELCAFALRDIQPKEGLVYYYGASYRQIKCYCGYERCEGFIGRPAGNAAPPIVDLSD